MSEEQTAPARTLNIYQRIAAVMKDVRGVAKRSHNKQGGFSYAGHEAVTEALRDAYVKHGIVRTASVEGHELIDKGTLVLSVAVSWINIDNPEDRHSVIIPGLQSSVKKDGGASPVQVGMALSYAVKNAEFKCFSLTGDDSPDAESDEVEQYDVARQEDPQNTAQALAVAYLARFSECRTEEESRELKEEIRSNWQSVRSVPNFGEHMLSAMRKAAIRIRNAKVDEQRQRMPGED
jgi:hypothetical protein